jgi:hypothetical protein
MMYLRDTQLALVSEQFRMDIVAVIPPRFVQFHLYTTRIGPCVLTDAGTSRQNVAIVLTNHAEPGVAW